MHTTIIGGKPYFHHGDFSEVIFQDENNEEIAVDGQDIKELILKNYLTSLVAEKLDDDDNYDKLIDILDSLTLDETFIVDAVVEKIKRIFREIKESELLTNKGDLQ